MCVVEDLLYHPHVNQSYYSTTPEVGHRQQADQPSYAPSLPTLAASVEARDNM